MTSLPATHRSLASQVPCGCNLRQLILLWVVAGVTATCGTGASSTGRETATPGAWAWKLEIMKSGP